MSDEDLPPTHQPWGAKPGPGPSSGHPPAPPPPPPVGQPGTPYTPPPNPYPQPGSFDQYAAPTPYTASPYGAHPGAHPGAAGALPPEHPSVNTGLVLGIVGLVGIVTCAGVTLVLSPFAWVISGRALREIDASGGRYSGREKASAGRIMGIIGTGLLVLGVIALVAIIALIAWVGPSSSNIGPNPPQVQHHGVSS